MVSALATKCRRQAIKKNVTLLIKSFSGQNSLITLLLKEKLEVREVNIDFSNFGAVLVYLLNEILL